MSHPYEGLPTRAFWRLAVGERAPLEIDDLWHPKFSIGRADPIATLGSCFAQHISRSLIDAGYHWLNAEPAPPRLSAAMRMKFQYDVFSCRVGNIYTVALLKQWVQWAFGLASLPHEVWRDGERFYDPFRPNIEPDGFASEEECLAARAQTIRAVRTMFETCRVFIFTLGLTEAWINAENGSIYPMCPGTIAGRFRPEIHQFKNYDYPDIYSDLCDVVRIIKQFNPTVKILLTVSPVPLTATASDDHVLVATTYSKSTLRAVAGSIAACQPDVDYFPSYEIISGVPFRGMFYEANLRSVTKDGVAFVMQAFLKKIGQLEPATPELTAPRQSIPQAPELGKKPVDEVCEEMILDAYGRRTKW